MPVSQNGYSANDRSVIASLTVPGTTRKIALRKGDTSVILLDVMAWIHANIEKIDVGVFDDWGYAERTIRGSSTTLSNHASGTAVDANATEHPLGVRGTWTADEKRRINARLALYEGCVRWGENYSGRIDGMHFEIDKGAAACRAVADKIRAGKLGGRANPATPPAGIPVTREENDVLVQPPVYWDQNRNFKAVGKAEAGAGSVFSAAWAFVNSTWGDLTEVRVFANDGKGRTTQLSPSGGVVRNNTEYAVALPAGTRFFTVEGRAAHSTAIATVSAICKPA